MTDKIYRGDVQSKYEFNSVWADRIGYLIIFGLAIQIISVLVIERSMLEAALTIAANVLIVAGVWGELWFARRAKEVGDSIVEIARSEMAKASERAAQAQLEQETLKAMLAWRSIPPQASAELERLLSRHPAKINMQWVATDVEAQYLTIQLANIFSNAKWQTRTLAISLNGGIAFGVRIPNSPSSADTAIIRDAFRSAQIDFSTEMPKVRYDPMGFGAIPDAPLIFIGSKPVPK